MTGKCALSRKVCALLIMDMGATQYSLANSVINRQSEPISTHEYFNTD